MKHVLEAFGGVLGPFWVILRLFGKKKNFSNFCVILAENGSAGAGGPTSPGRAAAGRGRAVVRAVLCILLSVGVGDICCHFPAGGGRRFPEAIATVPQFPTIFDDFPRKSVAFGVFQLSSTG